jgi:mono/diheme cytochrome c family protein
MEILDPTSRFHAWLAVLLAAGGSLCALEAQPAPSTAPHRLLVDQHCTSCHNDNLKIGGLDLDAVGAHPVEENTEIWEKVLRKIRARQMPPLGSPRPDEATYEAVVSSLAASLDRAAAAEPNPGRTDTVRRLTRTEYQNAIRDLLALELDLSSLLPRDEFSQGFDNITVTDLSPLLLESYVSAADKISRLVVGRPVPSLAVATIKMKPDLTQEWPFENLPVGTRGGTLVAHIFPLDAEYEIVIRLTRDRDEQVEGLREAHQVELLLDRERVRLFEVVPPRHVGDHSAVDKHLKVRLPVTAGPHQLGVTFLKKSWGVLETDRKPYQAHFNVYRHPRVQPAIYEVSITGPYKANGPGDTPSRTKIFACRPAGTTEEEGCVRRILTKLMRQAYRREVTERDFESPLEFYRRGRAEDGFEAGIEMALSSILVSTEFLFRVERDPVGISPDTVYQISDLELASRLSFFLWSSIPDEELLDIAIRGELSRSDVLEQQVKRMLADRRSHSLLTNFAAQWLHLRNLESVTPDMRLFPSFDDNLRQAMRQETELLLESVINEDRSVLDLLASDYTFLNERLAKHYRIPHVYGSWFRQVKLDDDSRRGGLLRHGSILTVTSYNTRTSPVIRGHWVLENLLGVPPPPPPANVPALEEKTIDGSLSVRERLMEHRANPACASCHNLMDPVGFSLENYDAVGRWRKSEGQQAIDASGSFPGGARFEGVSGLEKALLDRPDMFVGTLVEKLLTYSLGRVVEPYDAPAVRKIVLDSSSEDFRFSSVILGITNSKPFQMRRSQ